MSGSWKLEHAMLYGTCAADSQASTRVVLRDGVRVVGKPGSSTGGAAGYQIVSRAKVRDGAGSGLAEKQKQNPSPSSEQARSATGKHTGIIRSQETAEDQSAQETGMNFL